MRRTISILLLTVAFTFSAFAQSYQMQEGKRQFDAFNFTEAVKYFEAVLKKDSSNVDALQMTADAYRLLGDAKAAVPVYKRLIAVSATSDNLKNYGDMLMSSGSYDAAKEVYAKYVKANPSDKTTAGKLSVFDTYKQMQVPNPAYDLEIVTFNSAFSDFGPSILNGNLLFTSNRGKRAVTEYIDNWNQTEFLQLYTVGLNDATSVSEPVLFTTGQPDKRFHEGCSSLDRARNILYFDRSNYVSFTAQKDTRGTVNLKMFQMTYNPEKNSVSESVAEAFPFNSTEYSVCHPAVSADGNTIVFASDMPGGLGKTDLYKTTRDVNGQWSSPVNLGPGVNTNDDDMFPFLDSKGNLFFASRGLMGLGGLDIFYASASSGGWSSPINIGAPLNSSADDFGYVLDETGTKGFFVSNREGGMGSDDIYGFTYKEVPRDLKIIVYDATTNENISEAALSVSSTEKQIAKSITNNMGYAEVKMAKEINIIIVTASKQGYTAGNEKYTIDAATKEVRIPLKKEFIEPQRPDYLVDCGNVDVKDCSFNYIVKVTDTKSGYGIKDATVLVIDVQTQQQFTPVKSDGCYHYFKLDKAKQYEVFVDKTLMQPKEFYVSELLFINHSAVGPCSVQEVSLEKFEVGKTINIGMIYFNLDKYNIRPDAALQLNKIATIMKEYPTMEIEAGSHTDCRASKTYNESLSANRAKSCMQYIIEKGIAASRIVSKGYGESKLVANCPCEGNVKSTCSEEEHQLNRRTEFIITKM